MTDLRPNDPRPNDPRPNDPRPNDPRPSDPRSRDDDRPREPESRDAAGPDTLDGGLRAAFGEAATVAQAGSSASGAGSALRELESRMGFRSQVVLRDDPDGEPEAPIVNGAMPGSASGSTTGATTGATSGATRYQVHGEIARGGVGVVLKGRDADLGRDVAMKVLQVRHATNPAMVQRFVEEAQITGQLQHPGILPVYELGLQADDRPFFTMKLVKGRTLVGSSSPNARMPDGRRTI